MRLAACVGAVAAFACLSSFDAAAQSAPGIEGQTVAERFIGTYRLARYRPHGDEPIGRISYDTSGRMWAMLFPPGRSAIAAETSDAEYRATMRGVVAYYGTYDIDEATGRVIHHVQAASNPNWIGDDFVRWYRFDGANLILSLRAEFDSTLYWERLPQE